MENARSGHDPARIASHRDDGSGFSLGVGAQPSYLGKDPWASIWAVEGGRTRVHSGCGGGARKLTPLTPGNQPLQVLQPLRRNFSNLH